MKNTIIFFLAMTTLVSGVGSKEAEKCPSKLTFSLQSSKRICLSNHKIANENLKNSEKKVIEFIRKSGCVSIAVSTEPTCSAIGISNLEDSHCATFSSFTKPRRDADALSKCKANGCNCELVISEWKVVNDDIFFDWEKRNLSGSSSIPIESKSTETQAAADADNNEKNVKVVKVEKIGEESRNSQSERRSKQKEGDKPNLKDIDRERQQLAEERSRLEEDKRQREQARSSMRVNLQVTNTPPSSDGSFFIEIKTNADTASLQIDGKEEGGKADGNYIVKRVARAGQVSSFKIIATDVYGNSDTKSITVSRTIVDSKVTYAALNPGQVKQQPPRDAVAIIIGIADYKSLPKADFANDDARAFYDYAIRALGIKPENIKLLVDADAEEVEILRTFRNWVPSKVQSTTDVYVFYSGHGLPTADGQGLYLIPPRAARDLIDDTAIPFGKINAALQTAKPKSVTMILDACYSGQSRSGETLFASARPVILKTENRLFPESFTVITASQNDQISSSNPDLQHGIFSYYLMKGMEGDADANKDGKITLGEMQAYLVENVGRQAGMMNRKQEPQLVGDANRVLVGR